MALSPACTRVHILLLVIASNSFETVQITCRCRRTFNNLLFGAKNVGQNVLLRTTHSWRRRHIALETRARFATIALELDATVLTVLSRYEEFWRQLDISQ